MELLMFLLIILYPPVWIDHANLATQSTVSSNTSQKAINSECFLRESSACGEDSFATKPNEDIDFRPKEFSWKFAIFYHSTNQNPARNIKWRKNPYTKSKLS